MSRERRRARGRATPLPRSATRPPPSVSSEPPAPARRSKAALALLVLLGVLGGRIADAMLPARALDLFDLLVFLGVAVTLSLVYRRWARRRLEQVRARRAGRGR